jgi:hypothetical protein
MATLTDAFLADLDDLSDGDGSRQEEKVEDTKDQEVSWTLDEGCTGASKRLSCSDS